MALGDERISRMPLLLGAAAARNDLTVVVDLSASENKRMTLEGLAEALFRLAPPGSLDLGILNQNSTVKLGGQALAVGTVPANRIVPNSLTAEQIGPNAIGASELADGAVDTAALQVACVVASRIAAGAVTRGKIADEAVDTTAIAPQAVTYSRLQHTSSGNVLLGRAGSEPGQIREVSCTSAGRELLAAANTAAQRGLLGLGPLATAQGQWATGSAFSGTSSGTNTGDQTITLSGAVTGSGVGPIETSLSPGTVSPEHLAPGAVTSPALATGAVAAEAIGDNSTTIVTADTPTGAGAFVGQGWFDPASGRHWLWSGADWFQTSGVTGLTFAPSQLFQPEVEYPDLFTAVVTLTTPSQSPGELWIGPASGEPAPPSFRRLQAADLPAATPVQRGAIRLGEGLQADAAGFASLAPATQLFRGGVSVPGGALVINAAGALTHSITSLAAGFYSKVEIDQFGHVIGAAPLENDDIPDIDASKMASGLLPPDRIEDRSIRRQALSDYAIAYIQEADPGTQEDPHAGCLWLRESAGQLRMWNGNSWYSIGFGRLSEENLRYCGTFDADAGTISSLTLFGVGEGFTVGQAIPEPTDPRTGVYFVSDTAGTGVGVAPGVGFDPGDWILCNGFGSGWVRIDSALGGTGSGGAESLNDLLDVVTSTPETGDLIGRSAGGAWVNVKPGTVFTPITAGQSPTGAQLSPEQILVSNTNTDPALFIRRSNGTIARIAGAGAVGMPVAATTSVSGISQLATNAQALAGTSSTLALVPSALKHVLDSRTATEAATGLIRLATAGEAALGTDALRAITPATLAPLLAAKADTTLASTAAAGLIRLATAGEAALGTDALRAITPATLAPLLAAKAGTALASTAAAGLVRLATNTEVNDGTSDTLALTPSALSQRTATTARTGLVALANQNTVNAGSNNDRAVTPATLRNRLNSLFGAAASYVKGALLAGGAGDAMGVLAPAADGLFLSLDSTAPLGVRWATPPSGGGGASVDGQAPISVVGGLISVAAASTTSPGVVQLSAATNSTSTTQAATPGAVKAAWDLANAAIPSTGGTLSGNLNNTATGFLRVAAGTTAQRPASPTGGMFRFNSTLGSVEWHDGNTWVASSTLAPLASPAFTGAPTAPTAAPGTSTTQLATTAFVAAAVAAIVNGSTVAASANTLTTSRTLWGRPFDGSANVTGNLTGVGSITGTAGLTLTTGGANQIISLSTSGSGHILLDTGTNGRIFLRGGPYGVRFYNGAKTFFTQLSAEALTANRTLYLADASTTLVSGTMVATNRTFTAGNGLTGGGSFSVDRTIALGTGGSVTNTSTNSVGASTHTHAIEGSALVASAAAAVGSYTLAKYEAPWGSATLQPNQTTPGSNLRYSAGNGNGIWVNNTTNFPGTWRLMSRAVVPQADHGLWQRIS